MLEKIFGCSLITKLCSILLMEADFNATNKVIYGVRMLSIMRKYILMPEELFSKRNSLADDSTLSKVLFYDIVWQLPHPASLASMDANNCYNRIAHPMASMVFQLCGVLAPAAESIRKTIQNLESFLLMGYGNSTGYAGRVHDSFGDSRKTQGMHQDRTEQLRKLGKYYCTTQTSLTKIGVLICHKQKQSSVAVGTTERANSPSRSLCLGNSLLT